MKIHAQVDNLAGIDIEHPFWLYVKTNAPFLAVYRSVLVPDNDSRLESVNRVLNSHHHQIAYSNVFDDDNMMFGKGVATTYWIGDRFDSAAS